LGDALTIVAVILMFVGVLLLVVWPLRTIIQSAKVRGLTKLLWIGLWLAGLVLGGLLSNLYRLHAMPQAMSVLPGIAPLGLLALGVLPSWVVYLFFRRRTRPLPEHSSRAYSVWFEIGKHVRGIFPRPK